MKLADEIKKLMDKPQITEIEHKRAIGILGALMFYLRNLGFIH